MSIRYSCKLGTIPFANVIAKKPLKVGERFFVKDNHDFKPVKPIYKTKRVGEGYVSVVVAKVYCDVLFLTRM